MRPATRLYTGWIIVAGAALSFALSSGLMHAFTVFFVAFLDEFGWTRADASIAYALSQLMIGVSAPLVGWGVDRFGPRLLVGVGGVVLTLSLAASATVSTLWQLVVLYGVIMTLGANCLGLVVFTPLVSRWFVQRRGLAIAIVQASNGVGRAVATPVAQVLVETVGWRDAYLGLAVLMGLMTLPLVRVFRACEPEPTAVTRLDDAAELSETEPLKTAPDREWGLGQAMRTSSFWLLFGIYLCTGLGSFFVSLHQLAFAVDMGFDTLDAATALGVGSLLTIGGILAFGFLSDRIGREITGILAYMVSILGVVCALLISGSAHFGLFWLHACLFGITWGTRGPLITAKSADLFQGRRLGLIFGVISIGTGIGSSVGTWVSGWIFDVFGSYQLSFVLSIVSYLAGCVLFWRLRR